MGEGRMGLDHKERYGIISDSKDVWDVYRDNGKFEFPTWVAHCGTLEQAKLVRDALESFPKELEDYL